MDLDNEELKATKNREKAADEMFEELGYKKIIDNSTELIYEYKKCFYEKDLFIDFCLQKF